MDGGTMIRPASKAIVETNLTEIADFISAEDWDVFFIQEVDTGSRRSYYIDETEWLSRGRETSSAFAYNYLCDFVPFPFPQFLGKVASGLLTLNAYIPREALRVSLPVPFTWPVRTANLKRCMLVERVPVQDSDKELVLVNVHLDAYDEGAGREAQFREVVEFLNREYAKGNYCVAGGDFNQTLPGVPDDGIFAIKNRDTFIPTALPQNVVNPGWQFAVDPEIPTARLLNEPYSGYTDTTQVYVIDGFILSPNIELSRVKTIDLDFAHSDHNPVGIEIILR
jgi:endonuclease/exonuclease/phosphatase family metal-dependent hydrolase